MSGELERVRSDLSLMSQCLGLKCPWGMADVWFAAAAAAACGLYAACTWPGSPVAVPRGWAAVPIFASLAAYYAYMAVQSRRLPPREASRRREYRAGLIALACVVPLTLAYTFWGKRMGLTPSQLGGIVVAFIGAALFTVGIAFPPLRYPRSYLLIGGAPLMAFGPVISLAPPEYRSALIGLMGLVALASAAIISYRHLRRQSAEEGEHAAH